MYNNMLHLLELLDGQIKFWKKPLQHKLSCTTILVLCDAHALTRVQQICMYDVFTITTYVSLVYHLSCGWFVL